MVCELRAPIFDGSDYKIWKFRMITIFKSGGLWEIVTNGREAQSPGLMPEEEIQVVDPDLQELLMKDAKALGIIHGAVTTDIILKIIHLETAKEAWDLLEEDFSGVVHARSLQQRDGASATMELSSPFSYLVLGYSAVLYLRNLIDAKSPQNSNCLRNKIFKAGEILVDLEEEDFKRNFKPKVISIGPYHHETPRLKKMIHLKEKLTDEIIFKNIPNGRQKARKAIQNNIRVIKGCYADKSIVGKYNDDEFSEMMLVDGCFVLTFLKMRCQEWFRIVFRKFIGDEQMHKYNWVRRDLLLLENQIPYAVVQLILDVIEPGTTVQKLGQEFISMYANSVIIQNKLKPQVEKRDERPDHLLGHLWTLLTETERASEAPQKASLWSGGVAFFEPLFKKTSELEWKTKSSNETSSDMYSFRNITELTAAGIQLKPIKTFGLADIGLSPHWMIFSQLKLPQIIVTDSTEPLLRNLMAYEIHPDNCSSKNVIASFVCLLDDLIDGPEDVMQLRKARVLDNYLGCDQEVANLFNKIGTNVFQDTELFKDVKKQIQRHYDTKWKPWIAIGFHEYFGNPWSIMSFVAATYLLGLTSYTSFKKSDCDSLCGHLKQFV